MKILITALPGYGHLCPLIRLARAIIAAGHEAAIATSSSAAGVIVPHDIPVFSAGPQWCEANFSLATAEQVNRNIASPLHKFLNDTVVPQMLVDIGAHIDRWQPDIILSNEYERTGCVLAEQRQIPFVLTSSGPRISHEMRRQLHAPLYFGARRAAGLPIDIGMDYPLRWLHLCFMPVEYAYGSGETYRPAANEFGIRPEIFDDLFTTDVPCAIPMANAKPTVLCTLGTVFNKTGTLLKTVVDAVRDTSYRLIVTQGPGVARPGAGDIPANVKFVETMPLSQLLPIVDICITHGGTSTLATILSAGKPALLLPQGADQKINAVTCAQRELAIAKFDTVSGSEKLQDGKSLLTADTIRESLDRLMSEKKYKNNCENIRQRIAALPDMREAVELLERLARTRGPVSWA
jgi:UDP:flavonoid glycosyltransferase YjiC (YdhE family)